MGKRKLHNYPVRAAGFYSSQIMHMSVSVTHVENLLKKEIPLNLISVKSASKIQLPKFF